MSEPTAPPDLESRIIAWLQAPAGSADAVTAATVAPAVEAWVDQLPNIHRQAQVDGPAGWEPDTWLGATMLGARLVRRRNSPAGIESWTGDGAAYVRNQDPDVATLLRLDIRKPKAR